MKKLKISHNESTWNEYRPPTYSDISQENLIYDFINCNIDPEKGVIEKVENKLSNISVLLAFLCTKCSVTDEELLTEINSQLRDDISGLLFSYYLVEEDE